MCVWGGGGEANCVVILKEGVGETSFRVAWELKVLAILKGGSGTQHVSVL